MYYKQRGLQCVSATYSDNSSRSGKLYCSTFCCL